MNEFQKRKSPILEKPFPGCLGRMVNLFDLGTEARNRLLTDKPYNEGSPLPRSHTDISRMSPSADQIEDKVIMPEFGRNCLNKKPNGPPMKMLIDQEMSTETNSPHNPPGVVAKLMGLDALPQKLPDIAGKRSPTLGYSRSHSDTASSYWKEDVYLDSELQPEFDCYRGHKDYKDIYEIRQQSCGTNCVRDKSPRKGRYDVPIDDKKMALVRQKFMEAKRMATDEKLRQSKQFQDPLEVPSSNKDSFQKFLQEPNSLLSQQLHNMQSIPPPGTKRITVLRSSKMVDNQRFPGRSNELHIKKTSQVRGLDKTHVGFSPQAASRKVDENPAQPTRIIVLKPSPGKPEDMQAMGPTTSASPRISGGGELFRILEHNVAQKTREVAKTIPQLMRENLDQRDEILLSSVFFNGYVGDGSSFNKSENEYAPGNLSDSEVGSPASRHSWDCANRYDSPYSSSSFSRASYSPESSVCREAKKRLSERWAMMASNGSYQERKHVLRKSSTLGEMLALSDVKKTGRSEEECSNNKEPSVSSSFLNNNLSKDEGMENSPKDLVRSKSVPLSSTEFGKRLNLDMPDPEGEKSEVPEHATRTRSSKSSLRGKVSNFFFSRNKKTSKERSGASQSKEESFSGGISSCSFRNSNDGTRHADDSGLKCSSCDLPTSSSQEASPKVNGKQIVIYPEAGLSVKKSSAPGNTGVEELLYPTKSNQIDKSPHIGSIARKLLWEDSFVDTTSSYPTKTHLSPQGVEEEEEECLLFVQTLLSVAGFDSELQANSYIARWHSPESPLDPSLRDKYIDSNDKEILQEAKRRQRRSTQKLVFDCVNAAMIDIAGYGSDTCQRAIPNGGAHNSLLDSRSFKMVDQVWSRMKEWFSSERRCTSSDSGDIDDLIVETVVREEVVGSGWVEHLRLETDNLGKEIEQKLLEELVHEAVVELTGNETSLSNFISFI